jgi:hypothetical protein
MIILPTGRGMPLKPALIKDPFFSNVKLLMHCDGSQGGTVFTDSSSVNKSVTIRAGTVITTQSAIKFGTASLDINTGSLSFSKTDMNFTTATWTVEFWINSSWATTTQTIFDSTNNDLSFQLTNGGMCFIGGTSLGAFSSGYFIANSWYHIALVRSSGTLYYFINGSLYASGLASNYFIGNANTTLFIGFTGTNPSKCLLDDIRFTMGTARYTSSFSVPDKPFPNS